jgi:hypothetical protein
MVSTTTLIVGGTVLIGLLVLLAVGIFFGVYGYRNGWFTTDDLPAPKGEINILRGPYPVANAAPAVVNGVTGEFIDDDIKLGSTAASNIYARYGYRLVSGTVTSPAVDVAPLKKSKTVWKNQVFTRSLSDVDVEPTYRVNLFKFQIPHQAAGPLTSGDNSFQLIASYYSDPEGKILIADRKDLPVAQVAADTTEPVILLESDDKTYNKILKV